MALALTGYVDLPPHPPGGGFDHAAVHQASGRCFVAHTANDGLDVIDCRTDRFLHSIGGLKGVAGALVSEERDWVFTSNRGENTVGIFPADRPGDLAKVPAGVRPNGLAFDPRRQLLLVANAGGPDMPASATITMVDVAARRPLADIPVPGRTRWAIFDPVTDRFYVNIAAPALMAVVDPGQPTRLTRTMEIPVAGPHGLDVDSATGRLFCACDGGEVVVLAAATGQVLSRVPISGVPDVVFLHPGRQRLYVAVGNPGVIDVLDTAAMARIRTVPTERGGKTTALDVQRHKLYVFLPQTHRAAVLVDS